MFFELRQYTIKDGKRDEWVALMENEIIPFQTAHGMTVVGSFIAPDLPDIYIWIRRFESDEERASTGAAVYESEHWINVMRPRIDVLMDREKMVITRLEPTAISPLR